MIDLRADLSRRHADLLTRYTELLKRYQDLQRRFATVVQSAGEVAGDVDGDQATAAG